MREKRISQPQALFVALLFFIGAYVVYVNQARHVQTSASKSLVVSDRGILEGTVSFSGKECSGDLKPKTPPCSGVWASYEVVVYSDDGKTVFNKTLTNQDGTYSLLLPAGSYFIYNQKGLTSSNKEVHSVQISPGTKTTLDFTVKTGIQ